MSHCSAGNGGVMRRRARPAFITASDYATSRQQSPGIPFFRPFSPATGACYATFETMDSTCPCHRRFFFTAGKNTGTEGTSARSRAQHNQFHGSSAKRAPPPPPSPTRFRPRTFEGRHIPASSSGRISVHSRCRHAYRQNIDRNRCLRRRAGQSPASQTTPFTAPPR
jgi:hypothetical protein